MRRSLVFGASVLAATMAMGTGAGAAPAQLGGERIVAASAVFADPADCADGTCDALYLTAASAVLGAGSGKVRIPDIVLIEIYPSAVEDGGLFPIGEPSMVGCTTAADVTIAQNLRAGDAATRGRVELREFVLTDDEVACTKPLGHWLELGAHFTGTGALTWQRGHSTYRNPWTHEVTGGSTESRLAAVAASISLDGSPVGVPWPDSGLLIRTQSRNLVVLHAKAVGPLVRAPLHVTARAVVIEIASGWVTGPGVELGVDAMTMRDQAGVLKTYFGVFGDYHGDWVWGETVGPATVDIADDLSAASAAGTVMLYRDGPEGPEEVGEVAVTANWTGVGQPWRFSSKGVFRGDDGYGRSNVVGIHRDATLRVTFNGTALAGDGYLETIAVKMPLKAA